MRIRFGSGLKAIIDAALLLFVPAVASAVPFSGDILIQSSLPGGGGFRIAEYRLDGSQVQTIDVQRPPASSDQFQPRDLAGGIDGRVHVYNGTFDPYLSTFDPLTNSWSHTTHPGWSTGNVKGHGGIARSGNSVYVTDTSTAVDPSGGVVVFDVLHDTSQEFAVREGIDLTLGLDGKLWVLIGSAAYAYDPVTLTPLGSASTARVSTPRGLAVDASGNMYVASNEGGVVKLAPDGSVMKVLSITNSLIDIDISPDGLLIVGSRLGGTWLSDTELSGAHQIESGRWDSYVTFIPEPGTGILLGLGLFVVALGSRRRGRAPR